MKTAEEILKYHTGHAYGLTSLNHLEAMREYAKQVAEQSLEDATENAECIYNSRAGWGEDSYRVDKKTILNTEIKLP